MYVSMHNNVPVIHTCIYKLNKFNNVCLQYCYYLIFIFIDQLSLSCFFLFRLDTLQQSKARLELSNQTLKQQHQKELEGREEEVEQVRTTMNKKLKALSQQLEEMHEEKQAAVKVSTRQWDW